MIKEFKTNMMKSMPKEVRDRKKAELLKELDNKRAEFEKELIIDDTDPEEVKDALNVDLRNQRLRTLTDEIRTWSFSNFGPNYSHRRGKVLNDLNPLMGIAEELGELTEAVNQSQRYDNFDDFKAQCNDAIADMTIFLIDFCNRSGIKIQITQDQLHQSFFEKWRDHNLEENGFEADVPGDFLKGLTVYVGRLMHVALKGNQGIRGYDDDAFYESKLTEAVTNLYLRLEQGSGYRLLPEVVLPVWEKVKQRNWSSNPVNAHTTPPDIQDGNGNVTSGETALAAAAGVLVQDDLPDDEE